eukprot:TRINITY_DN845_c1_g1_i2.p1 TRINITY_DN845_c1_g1~~TRINITY_DN845_c1_g1_i2.p1  ORF type:complete len:393 (-),score=101.49 TRINITY_DN845_c1_g1_i2:388-1566(-)
MAESMMQDFKVDEEEAAMVPYVPSPDTAQRFKEFVTTMEQEDPARFEKEVQQLDSHYLSFAHSAMQGLRDEMEDRYAVEIDIVKEHFRHEKDDDTYVAYFGLFDGHGGNRCADYCSRNLLTASLEVLSPNKKLSELLTNLNNDAMLKNCFIVADEAFRATDRVQEREAQGKKISGSTAVTVWVVVSKETGGSKYDIIVASAGDSRCVMYDKGTTTALTRDHKPTDQEEMERIYDAGGFVSRKRVNSCLAMSRALGDFSFKQAPGLPPDLQAVTPVPDVHRVEISPEAEQKEKEQEEEKAKEKALQEKNAAQENKESDELSFLIIACDGLWDVMSNEEATAYVAKRLSKKVKKGKSQKNSGVQRISKRLCDYCVRERGSTDNVSIIIVQLITH